MASPGNRASSRVPKRQRCQCPIFPTGLTRVHQPPMFSQHGDDPAASPDRLFSAGVLRRRNGTGVAVEHGNRGHGCSRRHGRRVRWASTALHGPYAQLCRSRRLRHSARPSSLGDLGSCPVRVGITRLRSRAGIALGNICQTRTLPTDPRGLRLFSGLTSSPAR